MLVVQRGCGFCYELLTYVHEAPCSSKPALTIPLMCRELEHENLDIYMLKQSYQDHATCSKTPVKLLKCLIRYGLHMLRSTEVVKATLSRNCSRLGRCEIPALTAPSPWRRLDRTGLAVTLMRNVQCFPSGAAWPGTC